jgi:predicted enzyme related to lactoylglutathione lyase
MRWIELAPAGVSTTVALDRAVGSAGIDTGIRFAVPDAQTEHRALSKRGVTVSEILRWDDAPPMFTFEDPDGNRFYVLEEQA